MASFLSLKTRVVGLEAALLMCLLASSQGQQLGGADVGPGAPNPSMPEVLARKPPPYVPPPPGQRPGGRPMARSGPFAGAGFGGPMGPEGGPGIPPQLLARRLAMVQAARAAAARAAQDDPNTFPPDVFNAGARNKEASPDGRPVPMMPYAMPMPRPKGIPTRQGGTGAGGAGSMNQPQSPPSGVRNKRDQHQFEGAVRRSARIVHNLQSEEDDD